MTIHDVCFQRFQSYLWQLSDQRKEKQRRPDRVRPCFLWTQPTSVRMRYPVGGSAAVFSDFTSRIYDPATIRTATIDLRPQRTKPSVADEAERVLAQLASFVNATLGTSRSKNGIAPSGRKSTHSSSYQRQPSLTCGPGARSSTRRRPSPARPRL